MADKSQTKIIRVFPRRTKWTPTDKMAFIGDPDLFAFQLDRNIPVKISVLFSWDVGEAFRLRAAWENVGFEDVAIGGPAIISRAHPGEFTPGLFVKEGVTITSRGCDNKCPWCLVPTREGKIRTLRIKPGWIVQDNNLLACPLSHVEAVCKMLARQKRGIEFKGGLDPRKFGPYHRSLLDKIKISELWFSCDSPKMLPHLKTAYTFLAGIPAGKLRCYVMIGYGDETPAQAAERLRAVYHLGFLPFSQLYQPPECRSYSKDWRDLNRKWCRPAAYRSQEKRLDFTERELEFIPRRDI